MLLHIYGTYKAQDQFTKADTLLVDYSNYFKLDPA